MKAISPAVEAPPGTSGSTSLPTRALDWVRPDSFFRLGLVLALYALASVGGYFLNHVITISDILWPANGLLLAFLLPIARRYWTSYLAPSIVINIAAHLVFHYSFNRSLLFSVANTIEILIAGLLINHGDGIRPDLTHFRTLVRFVGFGVLLAPIASTTFIEAVLILWTYPRHPHLLTSWVIGDVMGMALMTPLILAMDKRGLARIFTPPRLWETLVILFGVGGLSTAVFFQPALPISFLLIPALLMAVFRLRATGGALAVAVIAAPAITLIVRTHGAFSISGVAINHHGCFLLQLFLCVCVVTVYAVEAALSGRDKLLDDTTSVSEADAASMQDYATGLANRVYFDRQLARNWQNALRDQSPLSLLIVDIDHFKLYNDHYGHLAGDECLRRIAAVLAGSSKRSTDTVARYGGEEFALLLPRSNASGAMILAERIRQAVADAQLPNIPYTAGIVTVSIGIATMDPNSDENPAQFIQRADRALHEAKKAGRNRTKAWKSLTETQIEHSELQTEAR
jgi:diguanylate cyclase (GGDEF)-like protein